jgi:hypothetical protein
VTGEYSPFFCHLVYPLSLPRRSQICSKHGPRQDKTLSITLTCCQHSPSSLQTCMYHQQTRDSTQLAVVAASLCLRGGHPLVGRCSTLGVVGGRHIHRRACKRNRARERVSEQVVKDNTRLPRYPDPGGRAKSRTPGPLLLGPQSSSEQGYWTRLHFIPTHAGNSLF